MEFIRAILQYLTRKGYIERGTLFEQPFTEYHYQGPYGLFPKEEVDNIIHIIDTINNNAVGL